MLVCTHAESARFEQRHIDLVKGILPLAGRILEKVDLHEVPTARDRERRSRLAVLTAILVTALLSWFVLRGAERFNRLLGATGMIALTRLTGFLMISIGVQFLINGTTMILNDPAFWSGLAEAIRAR
jgi:hypothetical protein